MTHAKKTVRSTAPDVRTRAEALRARAAETGSDPALAVIQAGRDLFAAARAEYRAAEMRRSPALDALFAHLRGPLLATKPTTAAGALALARYVTDLHHLTHYDLADEAVTIIARIAAVRAA